MEVAIKLEFSGEKALVAQARGGTFGLRLGLLFGRFGDGIAGVGVRISKVPGSYGRSDLRCEIAVLLNPKRIRVECIDTDLSRAFDRAAAMAVRAVQRVLKQEQLAAGAVAVARASRLADAAGPTRPGQRVKKRPVPKSKRRRSRPSAKAASR